MKRIATLVTVLALSLPTGPAQAARQKLTLGISSVGADRGGASCTPIDCTPVFPIVPGDSPVLAGRYACVGTSLADTGPAYRCSVYVGASLFGRAIAANVPVAVTFEVTSDDGSPWGDDVRRAIRGQPALMRPPAAGAPAPCSAIPSAEPRVSCAKVGPRTWKVSATTRSRTGVYVQPLQIEFPASSGTEPSCEYLRLKGTARSAGKTARIDLGRRRYCA